MYISIYFTFSTAPHEPRAKRYKTNHKSAVFDRLKQLKGKGLKNKYEVSDMDDVYEVIDEKEYSKKVWERQDNDWIVDDGLFLCLLIIW